MSPAPAPAASKTTVLKPFTIGSHVSMRHSFDTGPIAIAAGAPAQTGPQQVPAVGFLAGLLLHVTATATDGVPVLNADAPWNLIELINFRNSKGDNLITPVRGYQLYLINKYGGANPFGVGPLCDPKVGDGYATAAGSIDFYIWLPLEIDQSQALGVVPATASNNNYQVEITVAATGTVWAGGVTLGTAQVSADAVYWDIPNDASFQQTPIGLPTASIWNVETPAVTPGDKLTQSFNTGNVVRNHILVLRTAAGARTDADFPALMTLVLDNVDRLRLPQSAWEFLMARWFGLTGATKDAALGLDTGVYVLPYHVLAGGVSGDPSNTRDQLLQTESTTLLQFRGQTYGAAASTLEIITQSVATTDLNALYSKE